MSWAMRHALQGGYRNTSCMSHSGVGMVAGACNQVAEELGLKHFSPRRGKHRACLSWERWERKGPSCTTPGKAHRCAARSPQKESSCKEDEVDPVQQAIRTDRVYIAALWKASSPHRPGPYSATVYFSNLESKDFPWYQKFHKRSLNTICNYNHRPWLYSHLQAGEIVRAALAAL